MSLLSPFVIDLAAEGQALANILGSLSELGDVSKSRVLAVANQLVNRPQSLEVSGMVANGSYPVPDEFDEDSSP